MIFCDTGQKTTGSGVTWHARKSSIRLILTRCDPSLALLRPLQVILAVPCAGFPVLVHNYGHLLCGKVRGCGLDSASAVWESQEDPCSSSSSIASSRQ